MNNITPDDLPDLGDVQRAIMQLVWLHGPINADDIRKRLKRPLKDSTVRTVLRRLEEKGYVTHALEGRTFIYSATEARDRVAAKAFKRVVDWFCNGSFEEALVGMVDAAVIDPHELKRLSDKIVKAKGRKKS